MPKSKSKKKAPAPIGRPPIGDSPMDADEIRARFNQNLKSKGGRTYTIRLASGRRVEIIRKLMEKRGFKSETAAATWLLENSADKIARALKYEEKKENE